MQDSNAVTTTFTGRRYRQFVQHSTKMHALCSQRAIALQVDASAALPLIDTGKYLDGFGGHLTQHRDEIGANLTGIQIDRPLVCQTQWHLAIIGLYENGNADQTIAEKLVRDRLAMHNHGTLHLAQQLKPLRHRAYVQLLVRQATTDATGFNGHRFERMSRPQQFAADCPTHLDLRENLQIHQFAFLPEHGSLQSQATFRMDPEAMQETQFVARLEIIDFGFQAGHAFTAELAYLITGQQLLRLIRQLAGKSLLVW